MCRELIGQRGRGLYSGLAQTVDTLVKVVDPDAMRICRTLLWKRCMDSSSTLRKHWAVRSFVTYKAKVGVTQQMLHCALKITMEISPDFLCCP